MKRLNGEAEPVISLRRCLKVSGCGRRIVLDAVAAGQLKALRVGKKGAYRFRPTWIHDWLESCAVKPITTDVKAHV